MTFKLNADRILEVRAEDLATGTEKIITIQSTSSKLDEKEKQRMVNEAKGRVTQMLRSRVADTIEDEAKETIKRAEAALSSNPKHPQAAQLNKHLQSMRAALQKHEQEALENLTLEAMRVLAQIEAAGV